jgi:hypothetical protein
LFFTSFSYAQQQLDSMWVGSKWEKIKENDSVYREMGHVPIDLDGRSDTLVFERFRTPSYPGGFKAFYKDFEAAFKYPSELVNGPSGIVMVKFVVNTDGTIMQAEISSGLDPLIDQEVLRVFKSMKRWYHAKLSFQKIRLWTGINILIKNNK